MPKNKVTIITLIEYGLCAGLWIFLVIETVINKEYEESLGSFIIRIIAAALFTVRFIQMFIRFRTQQNGD